MRIWNRPSQGFVWILLIALFGLGNMSSGRDIAADPGTPFFMFTTSKFPKSSERDAVVATLRRHVTRRDYLSLGLVEQFPDLAQRIGRAHVYVLVPSLRNVKGRSLAGCGSQTPGLIIYDGEHWQETPLDEQADMTGAIAGGKTLVKAAGCYEYGVAPDGKFIGIVPSTRRFDLNSSIHRSIDWDDIALFNIQAQRLLSTNSSADVDNYVTFISMLARDVRAQNAKTKITAQFSFRYTKPKQMIAAMLRLRSVVDGFYLAYPSNVGPSCTYCSPQNLDEVLDALRVHA